MLVIEPVVGGGGVVPVPLTATVVGAFLASLAIEIVALRAPALCGVKVMVALALAPAAMVEPLAIPLTE